VHFLAIGALMFALYALVADRNRDPETIVVGQGQIDMMTTVFERTWQRAPTPDEVKTLIDGYVREEILYREGVAMGLDRDDQLIRRRVRQKVEFFAESIHGVPEPSDAALQAYLDGHHERFVSPARITFRQVYLGTAADADTTRVLAQLNKLGDSDAAADMGRPTQLDARMDLASSNDVARAFGQRFAQALAAIPAGSWTGPIASEYGLHLVRVSERVEENTPVLGEVRELVKRDWIRDELAEADEKYYEGLRARYAVRIEHPRVAVAQ
jgi:parvulin-like peptidyl-prolyl cis-trans isomerase-like protein